LNYEANGAKIEIVEIRNDLSFYILDLIYLSSMNEPLFSQEIRIKTKTQLNMNNVNPQKIINAGMMMFYQIATAIILVIILNNCKDRNILMWSTIGGIILLILSIRIAWNLVTCDKDDSTTKVSNDTDEEEYSGGGGGILGKIRGSD
jgi:hypothetical protein